MKQKQVRSVIAGVVGILLALVIVVKISINIKKEFTGRSDKHKTEEAEANRADTTLGDTPHDYEIDMVRVEGGKFYMGDFNGNRDEQPKHAVIVKSFFIGKYEVTQNQWKAMMGKNPSKYKCGECPVESVSWDDAQLFINKLNDKVGSERYTLPTEAEWEYAATGGKKSKDYRYSGGDDPDEVGWYMNNSNDNIHKAGTKQPNELGICDMSGNVKEWCSDWYDDYHSGLQRDPAGPATGDFRVIRGGGMTDTNVDCSSRYRSCGYPQYGFPNVGFRVVAR